MAKLIKSVKGLFSGKTKKTFNFRNGDRYVGDVVNNEIEGLGVMNYADGSVYDGEWKNGTMDGAGRAVYSNGNIYSGEWKAGL